MRIIEPSYEIDPPINKLEMYGRLERIGRTCYKSEDKITDDSSIKFVKGLVTRKHFPMLDHAFISVRFIHNRGFTHELVRHRIAAYAQESTRFCNYGKDKYGREITLIKPYWALENPHKYDEWITAMAEIERLYLKWTMDDEVKLLAQAARGILPQDLKTEIVATMNLTSWFHVFKLRSIGVTGKPHPDMTKLMDPLLKEIRTALPEVFGNIEETSKY